MSEVIVLSSDDEDPQISTNIRSDQENSMQDDHSSDCDVICEENVSLSYAPSPAVSCDTHDTKSENQTPWRTVHHSTHTFSESEEEETETVNQGPLVHSSDDELPDVPTILCSKETVKRTSRVAPDNGAANKPDGKKKKHLKDPEGRQNSKLETQEKRELKKKEVAFSKALKQATAEVERYKKPPECVKWITCILDPGLLNCDYSGELLCALRAADLHYRLEESLVPCSISWERTLHDVHADHENMMVRRTTTIQKEECVLLVWMWEKVINLIHEGSLLATVKEIKSVYSVNKVTIIIYGLEEYFRFQKTQKTRDVRAKVLGTDNKKPTGKDEVFAAAGHVSRDVVELALTELQILLGICHRIINSKTEMANIVCQFTKAIAETPFKRAAKDTSNKLEWFASADSLKGVAVDKDGKGLLRLWQQQLCQFNLATLETSEAIVSAYPSPLSLINAYKKCSSVKEAELLLQDIPVRRGPGPLSSTRRIGPQLSKKIHKFFSSTNGDEPIN